MPMFRKPRKYTRLTVTLTAAFVGSCLVLALVRSLAASASEGSDPVGVLYLVGSDTNTPELFPVSHDTVCDEPNLAIITHGWYERQP